MRSRSTTPATSGADAARHRVPVADPRARARRSATGSVVRAVALSGVLLAASCSGSSPTGSGGGSATDGSTPGGGSAVTAPVALPPCPLDALDKATQPVEVVVWHTAVARPLETLQQLTDAYNAKQTKVKVRLESQGNAVEELVRTFTAAIPTKQLPAIINVDDTSTQFMADSGVILPAQACLNAAKVDLSAFEKTVVDYYTIDGVVWPASANISSVLFFYNRDHFKRAGLDPDTPPTTLAQVREYAEKIKAAGIVDKPLVHELAPWKTEFLLTGQHASIVDHDNGRAGAATKATLADNPGAKEVFGWLKGMNDDGLMQAVPATDGQINQYLAMANRKASMVIESSGAATSIEAFLGGKLDPATLGAGEPVDVSGLDLGAAVLPGVKEPGRTQMGGGAWYLTNTGSPEVQAASWDYLTYLNGEDAQVALLTGGSSLPYLRSAGQSDKAKAFFASSMSGRWLALANKEVQDIDPSFPGPLIGPYTETRTALRDAMDSLIFKGASVDESLAEAQKDIDAALQQYQDEGF